MGKIIAVLGVDSFEVQVYQELPQWESTKGLPCVVYDEISGRIVSVSPEGRAMGIPRNINVEEATGRWPDVLTIPKEPRYDKEETQKLRIASFKIRSEIIAFIQDFKATEEFCWAAKLAIEQTGCDEFFLDLTAIVALLAEGAFVEGGDENAKINLEVETMRYAGPSLDERIMFYVGKYKQMCETEEYKLATAAFFMVEMLQHLKEETGYICSAGIGSNKVRAKIACKVGGPATITAMTDKSLGRISEDYDFRHVEGFGGDLGLEILNLEGWGQMSLADLRRRAGNWQDLVRVFGKEKANRIKLLANGFSSNVIERKIINATLNCSKGNLQLNGQESEFHVRLNVLAQELMERIQEEEEYNKRRPMRLIFRYIHKTNPDGTERTEKFLLSFTTNAAGEAQNLNVGSIVSAVVAKAITENPEFSGHLPCIVKMSVGVAEFRPFEVLYEDDFYDSHKGVFNFISGETNRLGNLKWVNEKWVAVDAVSDEDKDKDAVSDEDKDKDKDE